MIELSDFTLETFLLGIWHFIITERALECEKGKATISAWYHSKNSKNKNGKYNRISFEFGDECNLLEKLSSINVTRIEHTAPVSKEKSIAENVIQPKNTPESSDASINTENDAVSTNNRSEEGSINTVNSQNESESGAKDIPTNAEDQQRNDAVSVADEPIEESLPDSDDSQHENDSEDTNTPTDADSPNENGDVSADEPIEENSTDTESAQHENGSEDTDTPTKADVQKENNAVSADDEQIKTENTQANSNKNDIPYNSTVTNDYSNTDNSSTVTINNNVSNVYYFNISDDISRDTSSVDFNVQNETHAKESTKKSDDTVRIKSPQTKTMSSNSYQLYRSQRIDDITVEKLLDPLKKSL